jgi:hypothetical protein
MGEYRYLGSLGSDARGVLTLLTHPRVIAVVGEDGLCCGEGEVARMGWMSGTCSLTCVPQG